MKGGDYAEDGGTDGKVMLVRMYLREIWWEGVEWIHLTQDRDQ
jgi:hypothetical protein